MLNILWLLFMFVIGINLAVLGEVQGSDDINEMNESKQRYSQSIILVPTEDLYDIKVGFDGDKPALSGILKAVLNNNPLPAVKYDSMMPFLYIKKKEELVKNHNYPAPSAARLSLDGVLGSLPNISLDVRNDEPEVKSIHISDEDLSDINTRNINKVAKLSEVEISVLSEKILKEENTNEQRFFDEHENLFPGKIFLKSDANNRNFKRYANDVSNHYDLDENELRMHGSENAQEHNNHQKLLGNIGENLAKLSGSNMASSQFEKNMLNHDNIKKYRLFDGRDNLSARKRDKYGRIFKRHSNNEYNQRGVSEHELRMQSLKQNHRHSNPQSMSDYVSSETPVISFLKLYNSGHNKKLVDRKLTKRDIGLKRVLPEKSNMMQTTMMPFEKNENANNLPKGLLSDLDDLLPNVDLNVGLAAAI